MRILGLSAFYHDAAAALLVDGALVAAAEEERFSRRKHDASFPARAAAFCLERAGLRGADLDAVVFYDKPFLKLERLLTSIAVAAPASRALFTASMQAWLGDKLWLKAALIERLGLRPDAEVLFLDHHLSHAASAFFCSAFEDAAVLTVDGVGEWATAAIGRGRAGPDGARLDLLAQIDYPHSLGLFYSALTAYLGFEVNEGEYKVMGLAAHGAPRLREEMGRLLRLSPDGSFSLDLSYFSFEDPRRAVTARFESLFGPARAPGAPLDPREPEGRRYADIAASAQAALEDAVLALAREAHRRTGSRRLCLAGGVAFNSVANARLLAESPFEELFIQPAAGDAGGALGAALYADRVLFGGSRAFRLEHAYWGAEYGPDRIRRAAAGAGLSLSEHGSQDALLEQACASLGSGEVVGWFQGRFEWGPRALGHRSILADPSRAEIKERINAKIKRRELFRPFAPSILEGEAGRYFELPGASRQPLRHMLAVARSRPEGAEKLPAALHVDGTGRLQTVAPEHSPLYAGLLGRYGAGGRPGALLNTSFNGRGEPIVDSPEQAIATFLGTGLDRLFIGPFSARRPG